MLVITSNYPEQMPDGSVSGAKVMLDGIDDHAGWHIPLTLPKEYLDKPQSEVMTLCEKMIYQQLKPQKALNEKVDFTINKILEIGTYYIEVHCDGYVFPSDDSVTLDVRRSGQKYVVSTDLITDTTIQKLSADIEYLKSKVTQNQHLFEQVSPQTEWTITHNLIKYPSVTIVDSAGNEVFGSVEYISTTKIIVRFSAPFAGKAILN